jgi:uncharacterized protein (DUF302 family)
MPANINTQPDLVELPSSHSFDDTLQRLRTALTDAGITVFAEIDHRAGALAAGLDMPPATVLIFGNPKGGTPLMMARPTLALDLPMRVLVRQDGNRVSVAFHPAVALTRSVRLSDADAAPLAKAEALIAGAAGR